jgi:1-acyl-sn-glycerol-3-phosphate acyltransferase
MTAFAALPVSRGSLIAMTLVRLVCLIVALTAFLASFGPPRRIGQICGSRFGRRAPVLFNRPISAGLGVRVRRRGAFSSETKRLIVANHVSWLDIPVLGSLEPISFLAKKEIGDHPRGGKLSPCRASFASTAVAVPVSRPLMRRSPKQCAGERRSESRKASTASPRPGSRRLLYGISRSKRGRRLRRLCSAQKKPYIRHVVWRP